MISEESLGYVAKIIIIILCIVIFAILISDWLSGGKIARALICAALFWFPGGALAQIITGGCQAVPV